ncbi:hypothetical protein B0H16DRAFT_1743298 [Mycena metata]|uniref:Uncharacterized protein n=1 Tax=Mycena metata TaxID=1033252 RepID=A0AAD7MF25_9AGAR|nr:hypothetical protein B0H16DRAFT_1743298 [Mycena metata]
MDTQAQGGHSKQTIVQQASLSGRVLHVCHYLPVQAGLNRSSTPPDEVPLTPPPETDSPVLKEKSGYVWTLVPPYAHTAITSGIRSLSAHYWLDRRYPHCPARRAIASSTASLPPRSTPQPIPSESVTEEERAKLEEAMGKYQPADDRKTVYVPVWLEAEVAHGH